MDGTPLKQKEEKAMPVITIEAGTLTKEQKESLAREVTKTASGVLNLPEEAFIMLMKENSYDNIAAGGRLLSENQKG